MAAKLVALAQLTRFFILCSSGMIRPPEVHRLLRESGVAPSLELNEVPRIGQTPDTLLADVTRAARKRAITRAQFQHFLEQAQVNRPPSERYAQDLLTREKYIVQRDDGTWRDVEPSPWSSIGELEFFSVPRLGEDGIGIGEARAKAIKLQANFGLSDLARLLRLRAYLPENLKGRYVMLTGTVVETKHGHASCCLSWNDEYKRWEIRCYTLLVGEEGMFVRLKQPAAV